MARHFVVACWFAGALLVVARVRAGAQDASPTSSVEFHSSSPALNAAFAWAKKQALAYVRPGTDSIGPWYEAALPGRNAFCMRDVSHQTAGAAVLGLFDANHNMLDRFAQSVAPSRNWAGYWEIDGTGQPSTADYRSDDDFWFNLPANFDVLDAVVRMWRWTKDDRYRNDPRLRRFFRETLSDYTRQWQLQPSTILTRPRIVNRRIERGAFVDARGIPSYTEGSKDFIVGADLLAAEYRAIRSYQEIARNESDLQLADRLQKAASSIQRILETIAWSREENHFHGLIRKDLTAYGSADTMVLYYGAVMDEDHLRGALDYVSNRSYWKTTNIEDESYLPNVLFRYGRSDTAYRVLLDLSDPAKPRRGYPEVSFAVVAGLISGAMGIAPAQIGAAYDVHSRAQPMNDGDAQSVTSLSIRRNVLDLTQEGDSVQRLTNHDGPKIRWRAEFRGNIERVLVDGKSVRAGHETEPGVGPISWTIVAVPTGGSASVSRKRERASPK